MFQAKRSTSTCDGCDSQVLENSTDLSYELNELNGEDLGFYQLWMNVSNGTRHGALLRLGHGRMVPWRLGHWEHALGWILSFLLFSPSQNIRVEKVRRG